MAIGTGGAKTCLVNIVDLMAPDAIHRQTFPSLACVAGRAVQLGMASGQRKFGFGVVKCLDLIPMFRTMATATIGAQRALMRLINFMAIDADRGGLRKFLAGQVATCALGLGMATRERKICGAVVEYLAVQLDQCKIAALMVFVAGRAIQRPHFGGFAMKSGCCRDIGRNRFVAIQTKFRLRTLIKRGMAVLAILLQLGMSIGQFSGHHQSFEHGLCACSVNSESAKTDHECKLDKDGSEAKDHVNTGAPR